MLSFEIKKTHQIFNIFYKRRKYPISKIFTFPFSFFFFVSQGSEVGRGENCGPQRWFVIIQVTVLASDSHTCGSSGYYKFQQLKQKKEQEFHA